MSNNNFNNKSNEVVPTTVTTKANIQLSISEWTGTVTSSQIENYLQTKINEVVKRRNDVNIPIECYALQFNKTFAPLMVVLPLSTISGSRNNTNTSNFNVPKVFDNSNNGQLSKNRTISLDSSVSKALSPYLYNKTDVLNFKHPQARQRLKISRQQSQQLIVYSKPRITKFNGNSKKVVILAVDPLKILYDMLKIPGDNRRFTYDITKVNKSTGGKCEYYIKRYLIDSEKAVMGGLNISQELSRMVMIDTTHNKRKH